MQALFEGTRFWNASLTQLPTLPAVCGLLLACKLHDASVVEYSRSSGALNDSQIC